MSWVDGLRARLSNIVRSGAAHERELAEEIQHHLEMETARQRAHGHDPYLARKRALERFGDVEWVKQATRDIQRTPALEGNMHDLRWATRSLRKSAGFTSLAVVTLALGIGTATVAFNVLATVLLRPLPYESSERLVFMSERTKTGGLLAASFPNFDDWRTRARSFSGVASAEYSSPKTVIVGTDPIRVTSLGVSRRFFATLGVRLAAGREFTDAENTVGAPAALIVSHEFWQTQMGGRLPLGTIMYYDSPTPVVGVLPPDFRFIQPAEIYYPHERGRGTVRSAHNYQVIARLAPRATLASARAEMSTLSRALLATYGNDTQAVDVDIKPLREYLVGDYRALLTLVFGAASLVLLIACTNLVTAQLARGLGRGREVAVRAALGASYGRLARQLFIESGVLVACGALGGALLSVVLTRVVRWLGTGLVPRLEELTVDGRVLALSVTIAATAALVAGLYPAFRLAGGDPGTTLRGARGSSVSVRASVWRALVGFEIALAVVLVIGSGLLVRTFRNIVSADAGFDTHGLMTATLVPRGADPGRFERVRGELSGLPGVQGVAMTTRLPFSWGNYSAPVLRPGDPVDHDWPALAGLRVVTAQYFDVMRQPVLRGRSFTPGDREDAPRVAIITPGIAETLWPGQDPIGKPISTNFAVGKWMTVVGVVTEASSWTMERGKQNEIFVPLPQLPSEAGMQIVAVLRTAGDPRSLMPVVRDRLRAVAPDMPATLGTIEERIRRSAADRRFAMFAITIFGGIALLLAGIGIYGVISYSVASRSHEIGVRIALGATSWNVLSHVLRGAAVMAAGGILVGSLGGAWATKFLEHTLYGVTRLDPIAYGAGTGILFATALLGAFVPARRSSRIDPMRVIREE